MDYDTYIHTKLSCADNYTYSGSTNPNSAVANIKDPGPNVTIVS